MLTDIVLDPLLAVSAVILLGASFCGVSVYPLVVWLLPPSFICGNRTWPPALYGFGTTAWTKRAVAGRLLGLKKSPGWSPGLEVDVDIAASGG
jgi:hypothetical protein